MRKKPNGRKESKKYVIPNKLNSEQYTFNTGWKKENPNAFIDFIELDWIPRFMVIDEKGKISYFYAKEITDEGLVEALQ